MSPEHSYDDASAHTALRAWAKGSYHLEAAVELLVRGDWAQPWRPWIVTDDPDGTTWLDRDALQVEGVAGPWSGGERRFLAVALQVARDEIDVSGMDRHKTDLILAAIAHAAGTHEGRPMIVDHETGTAAFGEPYTSLHPWPTKTHGSPASRLAEAERDAAHLQDVVDRENARAIQAEVERDRLRKRIDTLLDIGDEDETTYAPHERQRARRRYAAFAYDNLAAERDRLRTEIEFLRESIKAVADSSFYISSEYEDDALVYADQVLGLLDRGGFDE